jgi:hypothetical protein
MKIQTGHPLPNGRVVQTSELNQLRKLLSTLPVAKGEVTDQSMVYNGTRRNAVYEAAKQIGITIQTEKLNGQGIRIWRTS